MPVFHQIRSHYERLENRAISTSLDPPAKVLARNKEYFITELPEKWQVDYERRNGHRHTGFFALSHVPFRTFGNLKHTDAIDLICDSLDLPACRPSAKTYHRPNNRIHSPDHLLPDTHDVHQHTIKVVRSDSDKKPLPLSRNAGLSTIRLALGANERSICEVNVGCTFRSTLKREEERAKFLQDIRTPKMAHGTTTEIHNPSVYLPPLVHTASSKACLTITGASHRRSEFTDKCGSGGVHGNMVSENKKLNRDGRTQDEGVPKSSSMKELKGRSVGPNLFVALAAAQFKLQKITGSCAKDQAHRQILAKAKLVYAILCCIHNIKMRDLRGKNPLSMETIKSLSKKPLHSLTKDLHHDIHHHPHMHHHHTLTHTPLHWQFHQSTQLTPTPHHGTLELSHSPSHSYSPSHHHHHGNHHHGNHIPGRHPHHQKYLLRHAKNHPTWDDLLALGEEVRGQDHGSSGLHHSHQLHTHRPHRGTTPPWQRQVVFVDADDDRKKDPVKKIEDCIEAFVHCKNEMAQEVEDAIKERQQHLQKHLITKLQCLNLGANVEECLDYMREGAYQISREERAEEENKPAWFRQLEREMSCVTGSKEQLAKELLEKIKQFIYADNDTIPHIVDKLCLVVMSLPAYQLCLLPVVNAIKFVLEHVLKTPPQLCDQWLKIRKLPMHITTELTTPTYCLGIPI